jgi:hypothetical protein
MAGYVPRNGCDLETVLEVTEAFGLTTYSQSGINVAQGHPKSHGDQ